MARRSPQTVAPGLSGALEDPLRADTLRDPLEAPIQRDGGPLPTGRGAAAGPGRSSSRPRGALPDPIRAPLESAFGADLSAVRLHADSGRAQELNASAYTQDTDVHFAPGQLDLASDRGRGLLGHEIAHVVQQQRGQVGATRDVAGAPVNDNPGLERQADSLGASAMRGLGSELSSAPVETAGGSGGGGGVVQRHLFTDIPEDKDLTQVDDLGMWWGMAAERQTQKVDYGNDGDPKDYISSLGAGGSLTRDIPTGETVRMLTHGLGGTDGEKIQVGAGSEKASDVKTRIADQVKGARANKDALEDAKFQPLYCFMGETKGLGTASGLGDGPLLAGYNKAVSVDMNDPFTKDAGTGLQAWKGGKFISGQGMWKTASGAKGDIPELKKYLETDQSASQLKLALDDVFAKIKVEYDDFISKVNKTGSFANPFRA